MIRHRGGCHCARVRFEVLAPARIQLSECNCSICSNSGTIEGMSVKPVNGRDWEKQYPAGRGEFTPD